MDQMLEMKENPKEAENKTKQAKESSKKKKRKRKSPYRIPSKLMASMWWIIAIATFAVGSVGIIQLVQKLYNKKSPDWSYALSITPYDREVEMVIYSLEGSSRDLKIRMADNLTFREIFYWDHINHVFKSNFKKAEWKIPYLSRSSSPVLFAGGGDMRILRKSSRMGKHTQTILKDLKNLFKSSGLKLLPKSVRILEDWEEAFYGWIALNYLTDYMTKGRQPIKAKRDIFTTRETLGVLDLGLTSLHVSYEIPKLLDSTQEAVKKRTRVITLYGRVYYIYTQSLICHGTSKMMDMYMGYLLQKTNHQNYSDIRVDGCFCDYHEKRMRPTVNADSLVGPCSDESWGEKYLNIYGRWAVERFGGNPNHNLCKTHIKDMFENCKKYFKQNDCQKYEYHARPYNITFVGINQFAIFAGLVGLKGGETQQEFEQKCKEICKVRNLYRLRDKYRSSTISDRQYHRLCLVCTYLERFLKDMIKLTKEEWEKLRYEQEVDGTKVSWYIGYLANLTETLPTASPFHDQVSLTDIVVEGLIFAAILSSSSIAFAFALRKSNTLAIRALQLPQ